MEQRRLRLGDILDDYCPRERRVTNHAVVAMIEDDIKQTRCTTCDAEHPYKGGKAPRKRKKDATGTLYKEVLAGITDPESTPVLASHPGVPAVEAPEPGATELESDATSVAMQGDSTGEAEEPRDESGTGDDGPTEEGPVHRRLIRATLPRTEGQKDARPLPEFTVRHSGNRPNGNQRDANRMRGPGGNGFRSHGGNRFAGPRGTQRGQGGRPGGFRSPQQSRSGGRKRSR